MRLCTYLELQRAVSSESVSAAVCITSKFLSNAAPNTMPPRWMISAASTGKTAPEEEAGKSVSSLAYPVRTSVCADTCGGVKTGHFRAQSCNQALLRIDCRIYKAVLIWLHLNCALRADCRTHTAASTHIRVHSNIHETSSFRNYCFCNLHIIFNINALIALMKAFS